jgi:hypothetical protein
MTRAIAPSQSTDLLAVEGPYDDYLPKKTRCYVTLRPPSEAYRAAGDYQVDFHFMERSELTSNSIVCNQKFSQLFWKSKVQSVGWILGLGVLGFTIPPLAVRIFMALPQTEATFLAVMRISMWCGVLGMTVGFAAAILWVFRQGFKNVSRFLAGRPMEKKEIAAGTKAFADFAEQGMATEIQLPVESVVAALGHESARVYELAGRCIDQLPDSLLKQIGGAVHDPQRISAAVNFR